MVFFYILGNLGAGKWTDFLRTSDSGGLETCFMYYNDCKVYNKWSLCKSDVYYYFWSMDTV